MTRAANRDNRLGKTFIAIFAMLALLLTGVPAAATASASTPAVGIVPAKFTPQCGAGGSTLCTSTQVTKESESGVSNAADPSQDSEVWNVSGSPSATNSFYGAVQCGTTGDVDESGSGLTVNNVRADCTTGGGGRDGRGIVYRQFSGTGMNVTEGSAYDPSQLPFTVNVPTSGRTFYGTCQRPTKVLNPDYPDVLGAPEYINDPNGGQDNFPCEVYRDSSDFTLIVQNPPSYSGTPDTWTGQVCNSAVNFGITLDNGQPLQAKYVGYKAEWYAGVVTDDGAGNDGLKVIEYTCIPPAQPYIYTTPCYRELWADIDGYIPNPAFNGPSTTSQMEIPNADGKSNITVSVTNKGGGFYAIKPPDQRLKYSNYVNSTDYTTTLRVCMRESSTLKWGFNGDFNDEQWGYGKYTTSLSAPYDMLKVVLFGSDVFGYVPKPIILWNQSRLYNPNDGGVGDNPMIAYSDNPVDLTNVWKSELHIYCSSADAPGSLYPGNAWKGWINGVETPWFGNKPAPAGLDYTPDDCRGPDETCKNGNCNAVNAMPNSWFCPGGSLQSYDGQTLEPGTDFVQTQADNLGRDLVWQTFTPTGVPLPNGTNPLKDVDNRRIIFEASTDSSPRLADTKPTQQTSKQPFTFTPRLNYFVDGWELDQRTLQTQFKEASRLGKGFTVTPTYHFTADLLQKSSSVNSYNVNGGVYNIDYTNEWINDHPFTCVGTTTTMEVLRVGVVPE